MAVGRDLVGTPATGATPREAGLGRSHWVGSSPVKNFQAVSANPTQQDREMSPDAGWSGCRWVSHQDASPFLPSGSTWESLLPAPMDLGSPAKCSYPLSCRPPFGTLPCVRPSSPGFPSSPGTVSLLWSCLIFQSLFPTTALFLEANTSWSPVVTSCPGGGSRSQTDVPDRPGPSLQVFSSSLFLPLLGK